MVIWLIGLSGAGKTTIGSRLAARLRARHSNLVFLDGDALREVWQSSLGHDIEGRAKNAQRISNLCRLLDEQGIHVVAAVLSLFPEWQAWNRENFSQYFEVFLDAPMTMLRKRDSKGLYAGAAAGEIENVVGIDIDFPRPPNPDLVIEGDDLSLDPEKLAIRIEQAIRSAMEAR